MMKNDTIERIYKGIGTKYIVFCHGFGGSEITYAQYEAVFDALRVNHHIVTFSFSGCQEEEYKTLEIEDIHVWVRDLRRVITRIYDIEPEANIYVCGISLGAWITTLYTLEYGDIHSNICIGPVFSLHMSMGQPSYGIALQHVQNTDVVVLNTISVKKSFTLSLIQNQPICKIMNAYYTIPTLLLVGEKDNIFRKTDTMIMENILLEKGVLVERKEIPKGSHFINNASSIMVCLQHLQEWLLTVDSIVMQ